MGIKNVKSAKEIKKDKSGWVRLGKKGELSALYTRDSTGRCYHMGVIKDNKTGKTHPIYTD